MHKKCVDYMYMQNGQVKEGDTHHSQFLHWPGENYAHVSIMGIIPFSLCLSLSGEINTYVVSLCRTSMEYGYGYGRPSPPYIASELAVLVSSLR